MQLIPIFTPLNYKIGRNTPISNDGLFLCPIVTNTAVLFNPRERMVCYFHNLIPQLLILSCDLATGKDGTAFLTPSTAKYKNMQTLNIPIGGTIAETLQELQAIKDACVTAIFNSLPFQEFLQDDTDLEHWQLIYLQSHSQLQQLSQ